MIVDLRTLTTVQRQTYLQHAVAPRPVCFASTIDAEGNVNLSPFSFFNMFSSNPPVVIFSPSRRVRDNTTKHTLDNILEVPEVAINIVDYSMVQQVSLASCEYPKGVNEFGKSGFQATPSTEIRPPLVKESRIGLECRVLEVKPLGTEAGAGNLVICEVLVMHIDDSILDDSGMIDQQKIEHVARLGGDWYTRVSTTSLFKVQKPNTSLGIGIDALPSNIRFSTVFTGNDLGKLANVSSIPDPEPSFNDSHVTRIVQYYSLNPEEMELELHLHAKRLLDQDEIHAAWQVLLAI